MFGPRIAPVLVDAIVNGDVNAQVQTLKAELWKTSFRRNPFNPVRYVVGDFFRLVKRWLRPTGIFMVVLGPDGVGKSTLVKKLVERLAPAFRRHRVFHWRPMVIAARKKVVSAIQDPHDEPPRGTIASILQLCVFFVDYWLGYLLITRKLLARSGLVVFDRYFQDLLVDPARYRYGGPIWLAELLSHLVPPPDLLFLVLDADEEVIFSRKREVDSEELRRQRAGYRKLTASKEDAMLIKTDQSLDDTLVTSCRVICDYLFRRFQRQHRWLQ
jgi:thymidylate kinase